ncbi:MAG: HD domain-containing protein [Candidatus Hodarchaeota archaeon]
MWKEEIIELVKEFNHPAWGYSHFNRIYELCLELATLDKKDVDKDSLFAASYLHDIGAFMPYKQEGRDHIDVAIEKCEEILSSMKFPTEKIPIVKDIIKSHMFYVKPSNKIESIILHDADTLDFMGVIGITRLLSIVGKDDWTPDLNSAIKIIERFSDELPQYLNTQAAKAIGKKRKEEMESFLKNLKKETSDFKNL